MNDTSPGRDGAPSTGSARGRALPVVLVALLVITLTAAGIAWKREHDRASFQERVALARRLALHAAELRGVDPVKARRLGVAAVELHADDQTRAGLVDTLLMWSRTRLADSVQDVALSADGQIALTGDGPEVSVWNLTTWLDPEATDKADRLAALRGHKDDVGALALSPDGKTALTGGDDGTTIVWELTDPARPVRQAALPPVAKRDYDDVRAVALTADSRTAVVADSDGNLIVWDLTVRSRPARLSVTKAHESFVQGLGVSADGRTVVTADGDGETAVWDLTDPAHPVKLLDPAFPGSPVGTVTMSADGKTVLLSAADQVHVWLLADRSHPRQAAVLDVPDVTKIALTPDGRTAFLAGSLGAGLLWDLSRPARPVRLATLAGFTEDANDAALSGDADVALMASPGGGASLWNLRDLTATVKDPERIACDQMPGRQTINRADWARYAGEADWSEYGGDAASDSLSVCSVR